VWWVADSSWKEAYLTFDHTVPVSNVKLGTLSAPSPGRWYEVPLDISSVQPVGGKGLAMARRGTASDVLLIAAREAGTASAPQLVVSYR
jgi:hypothetical protein